MAIQTIKLGKEQVLNLDSSIGWLLKYREQFGRDILPDLLPLLTAGVDFAISTAAGLEGGKVSMKDLVENLDKDAVESIMMDIAMLESTTVINIIWALNANYKKRNGEDVQSPEVWAETMDYFPLDVILPKALKLIMESTVSTKNLKRLQSLGKMMNQSNLIPSSLEQSQEDLATKA